MKLDPIAYLAISILAISVLAGCGDDSPRQNVAAPFDVPIDGSIALDNPPNNCLFIILDAFHAGHVSHLGYERPTTPNLDRLAESSISFSAAHSQSSNTLSSTVSFFTGRYPAAPAFGDVDYAIYPEDYPMAQAFKDQGFATGAFSESPWLTRALGFGEGFDLFQVTESVYRDDTNGMYAHRHDDSPRELLESVKTWIRDREDSPWFAYAHVFRPHNPYGAPEPFNSRMAGLADDDDGFMRESKLLYRPQRQREKLNSEEVRFLIDRYDANIAYTDHLIGEFLDWIDSSGIADSTLIVVASDHGEAFLQHGHLLHNTTVYQEMIHVPLIIHTPKSAGLASRTVDTPVELVDLYPTLAEIFSLKPKEMLHGRSALALMMGTGLEHKEALYSQTTQAEYIAIRKGNRKSIFERKGYTQFSPVEFYDLSTDPLEKNNLLKSGVDIAEFESLMTQYKEAVYLRAVGKPPELEDEQRETLEALGYIN